MNPVFRCPNHAPSERLTPVAPDVNNTLKLRTTMRSFAFVPSAGSTVGRTRDLVHCSSECDPLSVILACG
jgi:hypothetical protein